MVDKTYVDLNLDSVDTAPTAFSKLSAFYRYDHQTIAVGSEPILC